MEEITSYMAKKGGFATMKEMKEANIHTRDIANLVRENVIEKIKPGVYRLSDYKFFKDINLSLITVCKAEPKAVICLISALDFYEMTDFNPSEIYYAIPHSKKSTPINNPPAKTFYFRERFYKPGIEIVKTKYGEMRIYNKEKTVCDMFRYRNKLGEELAMQALKNYLRQKKKSIATLIKYAEICQVKTVMIPILKSLTA
ncbi:MAG: type IV toxin-antitoxin system AbiEi family antitoxin domain-containing protein [Ignavibacteria bacterium]|nr:type IV toxin-antitoxin system AbiEi family antitoxin domain-containing protein [Ignavibacteria bacterium]